MSVAMTLVKWKALQRICLRSCRICHPIEENSDRTGVMRQYSELLGYKFRNRRLRVVVFYVDASAPDEAGALAPMS